jgi:hypothetical protein
MGFGAGAVQTAEDQHGQVADVEVFDRSPVLDSPLPDASPADLGDIILWRGPQGHHRVWVFVWQEK